VLILFDYAVAFCPVNSNPFQNPPPAQGKKLEDGGQKQSAGRKRATH